MARWPIICLLIATAPLAHAGDLTITLPDPLSAKSSDATLYNQPAQTITGKCRDKTVLISALSAGKPYDISITLTTGQILRGVNLGWYTREAAHPDAEPLNDDDRKQITSQVGAVKSFYDTTRILLISGNHDRATTLIEEIRSSKFHSDAGDEVIWRIELWYWTNDFGGWVQPPQTSKIIERQRFTSETDFRTVTDPLKWIPELGGITLKPGEARREITLPPGIVTTPATQPANP